MAIWPASSMPRAEQKRFSVTWQTLLCKEDITSPPFALTKIKANQAFRDLRVTLEGTENRITVARNDYIQSVQEYNVLARQFPTNLTAMIFGYKAKPNFTVSNEAEISRPPTVSAACNAIVSIETSRLRSRAR